ncbi:insulinase family protein [bacterium]|nr:insulinase family protein [bacterium]
MKKNIFILIIALAFSLQGVFAGEKPIVKKLPSGQTVIVKQVTSNPIVTIDTWIKTGSVNENDSNSGVSHFLEHLFFKGTQKHPTGEFEKLLEAKGATTNASTSKDFTHYYITIPSKDFELALDLHADMLTRPLIPRKELEKERGVVLAEIARGNDMPNKILYNNLFKLIYSDSNHPYKRQIIGSDHVIETITREEILDYFNKFYTPDKIYTVIVGDVEPNYAIQKTEEAFKTAYSDYKKEKIKYPKINYPTKNSEIVEEKDISSNYALLAFKIPKFDNSKEAYALDVLSIILGSGKSSKLNQTLVENKQIANSISSNSSSYLQDGIFTISANYKPEYEKTIIKEIFDIVNSVKLGNITEAEIEKAKSIVETSEYYSRESIENISGEIGYSMLYWGNLDNLDTYVAGIKKVTKKDVIKAAQKYLKENNYYLSKVISKNTNVKEISDKKIKKTGEYKLVEESEKAKKYVLANGATLIIQKNNTNAIVAINVLSRGASHTSTTPSSLMLASEIAREGTKNYTGEEITTYLDERGISMYFTKSSDNMEIKVKTTKNRVPEALFMLKEITQNANFLTENIKKVKTANLDAIKNLEDNSLSLALDNFKKLAFEGSIYANNAEILKQDIPLIDKKTIKSDFRKSLDAKNLVIAVVGDVDEKEIIDNFTDIFESGKENKIKITNFKKENFVPTKNIEKIIKKEDKETAWLILGYKTCGIENKKEIATLEVINSILGDGMSSRLFRNIRETHGIAYQTGSTRLQNTLDGAFIAYIGTDKNNIDKAKAEILKEFANFKTSFVTQNELNEAKEKIIGQRILALETNSANAAKLVIDEANGRGLNYTKEFEEILETVTQNDIINVANKYFSKPYIMVVVE